MNHWGLAIKYCCVQTISQYLIINLLLIISFKIVEVPEFAMEQMTHMKKMHELADIQFITGDIDNDFATLLTIHHQGAIENSEAYLMYGNDPYLLDKAKMMVEMQTMEITELKNWLVAHKR